MTEKWTQSTQTPEFLWGSLSRFPSIYTQSFFFFFFFKSFCSIWACQVELVVKNLTANAGDLRGTGSIPGLGRSPGGGHGNPFQCSCLENPHGPRSLGNYGSQGCTELDTTEWLSTHASTHKYSTLLCESRAQNKAVSMLISLMPFTTYFETHY